MNNLSFQKNTRLFATLGSALALAVVMAAPHLPGATDFFDQRNPQPPDCASAAVPHPSVPMMFEGDQAFETEFPGCALEDGDRDGIVERVVKPPKVSRRRIPMMR